MDSLFESLEGGENREERLAELARQVSVCTRCDLALTRSNTVFGSGDPYSPLILVGEGPGENEDATGLPFVGRAGKLLDDILAAVNLTRKDVYITNIVKCRAAVQEGERMKNPSARALAHPSAAKILRYSPTVAQSSTTPGLKKLGRPRTASGVPFPNPRVRRSLEGLFGVPYGLSECSILER